MCNDIKMVGEGAQLRLGLILVHVACPELQHHDCLISCECRLGHLVPNSYRLRPVK
jgi:hypothetical protein